MDIIKKKKKLIKNEQINLDYSISIDNRKIFKLELDLGELDDASRRELIVHRSDYLLNCSRSVHPRIVQISF